MKDAPAQIAPPQCPAPPRALKTLETRDPVTQERVTFVVGAELEFKDVTDEYSRTFTFPGGDRVVIQSPAFIMTKAPPKGTVGGGSLRIIGLNGVVTYIPYGWISLSWVTRAGRPVVAF